MAPDAYLIYLAAVAVFFLTPPDTSQLLIVSNSVRHGLRRSAYTIAGDLTANSLQMAGAAFGLAAIITASASAFLWIKWFGVAYLAWIGFRLMVSNDRLDAVAATTSGQSVRLFRQGFITSMANPFAVVFFGALFPQFIDPLHAIAPQLVILGATYLVVDGLTLTLWGWAAERTLGRIRSLTGPRINRISGALMVAAAALLASKDLSQGARQ